MNDGAVMVAEHLELDVARVLDVLLDVDVADAERRFRFALGGLECLGQLLDVADDAHAAPAAARDGLDDDRQAEVPRDLERLLFAVDRTVAAREDRYAGLAHGAAGPRLVAEQADYVGRRADELDVTGLAHLGEIRALREKPVAGMDRVGAGDLRGADDRRHAEITCGAARW